jgi:hypothetical protein
MRLTEFAALLALVADYQRSQRSPTQPLISGVQDEKVVTKEDQVKPLGDSKLP